MDGKEPDSAAAVWAAVGHAREWAATVREHTAWMSHALGWEAKVESDEAMRRTAETGLDMEGEPGRMADELRRIADTLRAASAEFGRSSRLNRVAVAHLRRAAAAYRRAGEHDLARGVDKRIAMSSEYAANAAKLSKETYRAAKMYMPLVNALAEAAADKTAGSGRERSDEELESLRDSQASLLSTAGEAHGKSTDWVKRAREAEKLTEVARRATERISVDSTAAVAVIVDSSPGLRKAAAELKRATSSAIRAIAQDERRRRRKAGRGSH